MITRQGLASFAEELRPGGSQLFSDESEIPLDVVLVVRSRTVDSDGDYRTGITMARSEGTDFIVTTGLLDVVLSTVLADTGFAEQDD